jgi:hypothetical protein
MVTGAPEAAWELVAPRDLPTPISEVAALSGDAAVVIAGGRLFRWEQGRATRLCGEMDPSPVVVRADGDAFVAVGGDEATAVVYWSRDRGARCERVRLPSLAVPPHTGGTLGAALQGGVALVWSTSGATVRADDGGATWRLLPALPGLAVAGAGRGAQTLAAAQVDRDRTGRDPAARLFVLPSPSARAWQPLDNGPDRRLPLAFQPQPDGRVLVADALGLLALAPDGTVARDAPAPAFHTQLDLPRAVVPAGPARFLVWSGRTLRALDEQGPRAFALAPAPDRLHLSANAAGVVWASTPRSLFRGALGQPAREVTQRPLGEGTPRLLAVAGPHLAMVASNRVVARSDDGGARWTRAELPEAAGEALALAVGRRGEALVLATGGLFVSEDDTFTRVDLPPHASPPPGAARALHVAGDRWIVVEGAVMTSDDEGANWRVRLGVLGTEESPVLAAAFHASAGLLLDAGYVLWRTDDGASTFQPASRDGSLARLLEGRVETPVVAWDGAQRVALISRTSILRSSDGGASWTGNGGGERYAARLATFAPDGRLVAVARAWIDRRCARSEGEILAVEARDGRAFEPVPDACAHEGAAFAFDNGSAYVASPGGTISRAVLARLLNAMP